MNSLPSWAEKLLRAICPDELYEQIEGDLIELYNYEERTIGKRKARLRLVLACFRFLRPGILLRNRIKMNSNPFYMFLSYLKIALRSFQRQRFYAGLNVVGLALGIAASLLIFKYVQYERSFDSFHKRAKDIYRIQYNLWQNGQLNFESAMAVPAVGPALKNNFAEVEEFTRLYPTSGTISYIDSMQGRVSFREDRMMWADSSLFNVFDFKIIKGESGSLKDPNTLLLSSSAATRYFGNSDPIGKVVTKGDKEHFKVIGVFEDVPENSHIKFDLLLSYETLKNYFDSYQTAWNWYDFYTYVLLKPGTDVGSLQSKWDSYLEIDRKQEWGETRQEFILRPLLDIHLNSNLLYEALPKEQRDGDSVHALSLIAVFIIVIAWINYINMATARSFKRANEVGVRKTIGALKKSLIMQFMVESTLLNLMAFLLALGLVYWMWHPFSLLTGWHIPIRSLSDGFFWKTTVLLFVAGTFFSGFYPAMVLSSFKPVAVLKSKVHHSAKGMFLRKSLVVIQFATSVFLVAGTVIAFTQMDFMKSKRLGIDIKNVLILKGPGSQDSTYTEKLKSFKTEMLRMSGVKSMSSTTNIPGDEIYWTGNLRRLSGTSENQIMVNHAAIDYDFVPAFGIQMIAGRNFSEEVSGDVGRVLVNRALAKALDFGNPASAVGEKIIVENKDTVEIAGVIEDYHQMSLKNAIAPMAFVLRETAVYYAVKLSDQRFSSNYDSIEKIWGQHFPDSPLSYFFLEDFYNQQYEREDRFSRVFSLFAAMALFITSLGMVGLASLMTAQRRKEVGVRKVLGASATQIATLFSREYVLLALAANLIGLPLAWLTMEKWLQGFAYHSAINPIIILASGLGVVFVAFASVAVQTIKTAAIEPAITLKYE
jgi:putative ABC transport system permease protein